MSCIIWSHMDEDTPDSGWRFLAGDEDEAYMNDSSNHHVFSINTICNYDRDIIPYIHAESGTKNYAFSTHDTHSELCDAIRISKGYRKEKWGYFLRAESFYNVATKEEEYADLTHPSAKYHEKSHGESFLALAQNNLRPNGLYLFDEPEAALSPQRQLTLLMQIYSCAKEGAQFIIVTHSPILLGIPDADIYCFDNGRIHLCEYEDTESYQVTEMFINNRQMLLDRLLTD